MISSFEFKTYDDFSQIVKDFLLFSSNTDSGMMGSFVYRVSVYKDNAHTTLSLDKSEENKK